MDEILFKLEDMKSSYDLNGVEITDEDARNVESLIQRGMSMDDAVADVLNGIRSVVSQGWEF